MKWWQWLVSSSAVLVVACGGGGSASAPTQISMTTISGVVSDDPIAGATVLVSMADSGATIGSTTTAGDGTFSITAPTASFGSGFLIRSTGGKMNGTDFAGSLAAMYGTNAIPAQANATLLTTALVDAAAKTTKFAGTPFQKHEAVKAAALARGLIPADYAAVAPSTDMLPRLQADTAAQGVTQALASLVERAANPPVLSGCGANDNQCTIDIGPLDSVAITLSSGATVTAAAGVSRNCRVAANYDSGSQKLTARFENSPSSTGGSTPPLGCLVSGSVTLSLPTLTNEAPNACLAPDEKVFDMPACVTVGAGMTPNFYVDDGAFRHRISKPTVAIVANQAGADVNLSRGFSAVLHASRVTQTLAEGQWKDKTAIILVHGFQVGGGFGGGGGTWGALPSLIMEDEKVVLLEFRWVTDASFVAVAAELAKAVEYAAVSTGRKVHIVAHSFGGVLSRVMLQNLNADPAVKRAAQKVATLTTVGTPHSGIASEKDSLVSDLLRNVVLPKGWGIPLQDGLCGQATCYQAGLKAKIAPWALSELKQEAGTDPSPGYVIARLSRYDDIYPFPSGLKIRVLIGTTASIWPLGRQFDDGDGLISYDGQRFKLRSPDILLSGTVVGGAEVTEQILGLGIASPPSAGTVFGMSVYSRGGTAPAIHFSRWGYKHLSLLKYVEYAPNAEVNIPVVCGSASLCEHDTWKNLNAFLLANPAGCLEPRTLQADACVDPPATVTSVTPAAAAASVATTFTVAGSNLPLTATLNLQDGTCGTPTAQSNTGFAVSCTPGGSGVKNIAVFASSGGAAIDATRTVTVTASTQVYSFFDSFDGVDIDPTKWTRVLHPTYAGTSATVSAGELRLAVGAFIHTFNKAVFTGSKIVVEGVMGDAQASMLLLDNFNPLSGFSTDVIQGSDTTYRSWGFDVQTTGRYAIIGPTTVGTITVAEGANVLINGQHNAALLYRRLTIDGDIVTYERGSSANAISEKLSTRIASRITGRPMTLLLGTGVGPYTPGRFQWISVTVTP